MLAGPTKRGVPADYDGSDSWLCNARTKSGRPCRALKLDGGRCKWHGGLSTGPTSAAGKEQAVRNLALANKRLAALRADVRKWAEARSRDRAKH